MADVTIPAGGSIDAAITGAGVLTVFQKTGGGGQPPSAPTNLKVVH
jgi:hypothetical protein